MKYADVVYAGVPIAPAGLPSDFTLKGFRVVPILGAAATVADVAAAYAPLVVRVSRNSQSRSLSQPAGTSSAVVDDVSVVAPDWHRSPGFNSLLIQGGQAGVTYRVWWAEDCLEMLDPGSSPFLNGFSAAGSSTPSNLGVQSVQVGPGGTSVQAQSSVANIPTAAGDGYALRSGAKGFYAVLTAPAGQTINGTPTLVWWRYNSLLSRWVETGVQESPPTGRLDVMGVEQSCQVAGGSERVYCEARNCSATGAGNLTVTITSA